MKFLLSLIFTVLSLTGTAHAQVTKHPRVVEMEKELAAQGLEILKGRFPSRPFMLTVSIDPLMRMRSNEKGEKLPAYDVVDEEIVDEWDDPAIANSALLSRVRKIQVRASVPSQLSEDEISELRSALFLNLSLIEARDNIEIQKRNWTTLADDQGAKDWLLYLMVAAVVLAGSLAGLFALVRFGTDRLGRAYREAAASTKSGSAASASVAPAPGENNDARRGGGAPASGDLRFNDPIRTREMIAGAVKLLEEHRSFPTLEDMIVLDRFAHENPAALGALMSEFSYPVRQRILSYSSAREWLTGLSEPGEVSLACVEVLNRCLRVQRNDMDKDWQELLVLVWRLEVRIVPFLSGLNSKDAFAVLSCLPKMVAIPAAREAYPGAWASLLDSNSVFERPAPPRIEELKKKALEILPARNDKSVEKYRRERELLSFLKYADPGTEKEIYTTAGGGDSFLHELRPPFFAIFDCSPEVLDALVPRIRVDEWALAFFNTNRLERREIEKRFGDKQRIRYFELLKSFDTNTPSKDRIGDAREHIGLSKVRVEQELSKQVPETQAAGEAA